MKLFVGKGDNSMPKIVISLTSYPARINTIHQTIDSLFRQRQKADEIVLWLSVLEFPNKNSDLPDDLKVLAGKNGFRIEWVTENLKSHKKYFYALQNKDNITITVDDDMYYSDTMVETLMDSYRLHPKAISARNVSIMIRKKSEISPYMSWEGKAEEYIGEERSDLCAIGVSGILYPPGCATEKWFDIDGIVGLAKNQDDLWLKYNEIIDGLPVVYAGINKGDLVIEGSQNNRLCLQNAYGGDNDICMSMLLKKLLENHKTIYQDWIENLMQIKEVLFIKRKYYGCELNDILEKRKGKDIYICGAGQYAHVIYDFIKSCGKEKCIKAFLVTGAAENKTKKETLDIRLIRNLDRKKAFCVICGVGEKYKKEMKTALQTYEAHEWIDLDNAGIAKLLQLEKKHNL